MNSWNPILLNAVLNSGDVELLLKTYRHLVNIAHPRTGMRPFYAAVKTGNLDLVKLLIRNGAIIDDLVNISSPMHAAVQSGSLAVVEYLIQMTKRLSEDRQRCAFDSMDNRSKTPIMYSGEVRIVRALLETGMISKDSMTNLFLEPKLLPWMDLGMLRNLVDAECPALWPLSMHLDALLLSRSSIDSNMQEAPAYHLLEFASVATILALDQDLAKLSGKQNPLQSLFPLHDAIIQRDESLTSLLIDWAFTLITNPSPGVPFDCKVLTYRNEKGETPLMLAVQHGDDSATNKLLHCYPDGIIDVLPFILTTFNLMIIRGALLKLHSISTEKLDPLLRKSTVDLMKTLYPLEPDEHRHTVVKMFLERILALSMSTSKLNHICISRDSKHSFGIFQYLLRMEDGETIGRLLKVGLQDLIQEDLWNKDEHGRTPFEHALHLQHSKLVQSMIEYVDVNKLPPVKMHLLYQMLDDDLTSILIRMKALRLKQIQTCSKAIPQNKYAIYDLLRSMTFYILYWLCMTKSIYRTIEDPSGEIINTVSKQIVDSPLCLAIQKDDVLTARLLLDFISIQEEHYRIVALRVPLWEIVLEKENIVILKEMLRMKIGTSEQFSKALFVLIKHGDVELISYLIDCGADINYRDSDGKTALHHAAERNHFECVRSLDKYGCDAHVLDNEQKSALDYTIDVLMIEELCRITDPLKQTRFHQAAIKGEDKLIHLMMKHGYRQWNMPDIKGRTPMHYAVLHNHVKVIEALILISNGRVIPPEPKSSLELSSDGVIVFSRPIFSSI